MPTNDASLYFWAIPFAFLALLSNRDLRGSIAALMGISNRDSLVVIFAASLFWPLVLIEFLMIWIEEHTKPPDPPGAM